MSAHVWQQGMVNGEIKVHTNNNASAVVVIEIGMMYTTSSPSLHYTVTVEVEVHQFNAAVFFV